MKKAQIFSMDLIIGTIIFMITLGVFYGLISDSYTTTSAGFNLNGDAVFNAIDMSDDVDFMDGYYINTSNFKPASDYNSIQKVLINKLQNNYDISKNGLDFCLYFVNKSGKISKSVGKSGLPINLTSSFNCGDIGAKGEISKPSCQGNYTLGANFLRPVLYGDAGNYEMMKMNILLCGKTEYEN